MTRESLVARDGASCWHPYTQHGRHQPVLPIVGASGAYLIEEGGRRLLDAVSSWWVTTHGHGHPAIVEAIATQAATLDHVLFAGCTHEPAVGLAENLLARLPAGLSRVFYSDDGSTAVEVAVKIVVQYWRNRGEMRRRILALEHAYHGDTVGAMSVSARGLFTEPFGELLFQVERLPAPDSPALLPTLESVLEARGDDIAGVLVEPMVQGAGGMRMWSADTLRSLAQSVQAYGIPLIADEVMTGFGRTGPLFACEHAGISPDLICLSKGLTGGVLPLGVTAVREELFEGFLSHDRRLTFFHGHSYTANPIACAAARASLGLFDGVSAERRRRIEQLHRQALERVREHPRVANPRVLGTIAAFELDESGSGGYLSPVGGDLAHFAQQRGVFLRPLGSTVYLMPPYCITDDELGSIHDVLYQYLAGPCCDSE